MGLHTEDMEFEEDSFGELDPDFLITLFPMKKKKVFMTYWKRSYQQIKMKQVSPS